MRRILLLVTVASMLAAAMAFSGVAQAAPISGKADAQCAKLAIKTLGPSFNPSTYTFHGGTDDITVFDDFTGQGTLEGNDVFCGFSGPDRIDTLQGGDIFLGGEGFDSVTTNNGTFYGGAGEDNVDSNNGTFNGGEDNDVVGANSGTFNGEAGRDFVFFNFGTFNGGEGDDVVGTTNFGTFNGEAGNDHVESNNPAGGTFNGGEGDDSVTNNFPAATFDGGAGTADRVGVNDGGCLISVESGDVLGSVCIV